jgi:hypothetical protein
MQEKNRKFSIIKERILQYLDFKGISKYECYQNSGIVNGVLSQKGGISEENTLKFISYYTDISTEWLFTGRGEMLKRQEKSVNQSIVGDNNIGNNQQVIGNVSGTGINVSGASYPDLMDIVKRQQEQIGKLIETVNNLSHK